MKIFCVKEVLRCGRETIHDGQNWWRADRRAPTKWLIGRATSVDLDKVETWTKWTTLAVH